jgi:hypothetical protein
MLLCAWKLVYSIKFVTFNIYKIVWSAFKKVFWIWEKWLCCWGFAQQKISGGENDSTLSHSHSTSEGGLARQYDRNIAKRLVEPLQSHESNMNHFKQATIH